MIFLYMFWNAPHTWGLQLQRKSIRKSHVDSNAPHTWGLQDERLSNILGRGGRTPHTRGDCRISMQTVNFLMI